MADKNLKARIVHKHDTEANWQKATGFIPKMGELIVYDIDSTYGYERFKIGDGATNVNSLPFADAHKVDQTYFQDMVGDVAVSTQIDNAISAIPQADWNQNDTTADDYINNRPFYSNFIEYKWDGSSDGRDTFTYGDITYTKVSDDIYTEDELIANGGIYLDGNLISSLTSDNFVDTTGQYSNLFWVCKSTSILVDPVFLLSITVPSTGIYYTSELQTSYLAINDIKKIDKKFLPSIDYSEILNTPAIRKTNIYNAVALNDSNNKSTGFNSLAEGSGTEASGDASHAEGKNTIAAGRNQHAEGKYNIKDTSNKYAHIVGNGTSNTKRSNAHTLDWSGNAWYAGEVKVGGTSRDDATAKTLATIDSAAKLFTYKGYIRDEQELETSVTNPSIGDSYSLEDTTVKYWNGSSWVSAPTNVVFSNVTLAPGGYLTFPNTGNGGVCIYEKSTSDTEPILAFYGAAGDETVSLSNVKVPYLDTQINNIYGAKIKKWEATD